MWCITFRKQLLLITFGIMAAAIGVVMYFGLPLGIDFTGGALTEVVYENRPEQEVVNERVDALDLGGYSVRETTDEDGRAGYIIRTRDLEESERQALQTALFTEGSNAELSRFTSIGPVIGNELQSKAVWAIAAVSIVIILYVAFAFAGVSYPVGSFVYGGITIVALLHDVLLPTAAMALLGVFLGVEADVLFVMALLAVLGYSVNDTIVVFDRVRENLVKYRKEQATTVVAPDGLEREEVTYELTRPFSEIVGVSLNQTIVRSINTSLTTILALGALYVFGGEVTKTFTLVLMVGVLAGTYSSICFANPLLVWFGERALAKKEVVSKE